MTSAALSSQLFEAVGRHLLRQDGQEDLGFLLWQPSEGGTRVTAIATQLVEPLPGERSVHGNASFEPAYFERSLSAALEASAGLAFIHSHPQGRGWQGMSPDDERAEQKMAAAVLAATGQPLVGLTMAGDGALAARWWERRGTRAYRRVEFDSVRVVGDRLRLSFNEASRPLPPANRSQARSAAAWGPAVQGSLAWLRVGVVGAGSVGSLVAEALARTGVSQIDLIDFDSVKEVNLDRLLHATMRDVQLARAKVEVLGSALRRSSTAAKPSITLHEWSVAEAPGFRAALDCDVLFSCVDRPWARAVLNFIAYAHLIPVVDGGIRVRTHEGDSLRDADWRAHIAAPGRRCLECLGQFDPGLVQAERDGYLDMPGYIEGLPLDHPLRLNENVFAFSLGAASLELAQLIAMVAAPSGVSDLGALHFHLASTELGRDVRSCEPTCPYSTSLLSTASSSGLVVTGRHTAAEMERSARARARSHWRVRAGRLRAAVAARIA